MRAVNLIPSEHRGASGAAGRSQGAAYAVVGLLAGLAILALVYGLARHQVSTRTTRAAELTRQAQQAEAAASQLAPYTSFIALREQRTQAVSQLVDSRFDWAHAFHEIGRVLPSNATISSLSGTIGSGTGSSGSSSSGGSGGSGGSSSSGGSGSGSSGGSSGQAASASSVTSATPPGSVPTFTLVGCASSQAEVALTLERLRLIDGVGEVTLQSSTKSNAGSSSTEGGCPGGDPAFTAVISFDPLPAASTSATSAVSDTNPGGAR